MAETPKLDLKYGDVIEGWRYRDVRPVRGKNCLLFSKGEGAEGKHHFIEAREDLTREQIAEELRAVDSFGAPGEKVNG